MKLLRIIPLLDGGAEVYLNAFHKIKGRSAFRADYITDVSKVARS